MPFLLANTLAIGATGAISAISAGLGLRSSSKARRLAIQEGTAQTSDLQREAGIAESALLEQARAADSQRGLIAERLLLQGRQESEATRQASQPGVEFTLGGGMDRREAQKRRTQFFDYGAGA